jgi:acetate kinase
MMNILAINSGSSSLKFKVVEFDESPKPGAPLTMSSRYAGFVEDIGPAAKLMLRLAGKTVIQRAGTVSTHGEAAKAKELIEKAEANCLISNSPTLYEAESDLGTDHLLVGR